MSEVETELDEALKVAREKASHANFFYDAFLNTTLFFPVISAEAKEGSWRRLGMTEKFHPLFLAFGGERKVVPLFDRLERLKAFAAGKPLDYLELKGHVLLKLLSPEVAILLNPGSPLNYTFRLDVLEKLRQAMKPIEPV